MELKIDTFIAGKGGNTFFKAITHPLVSTCAAALLEQLKLSGPVAIYDPFNLVESFAAIYSMQNLNISAVYVQAVDQVGQNRLTLTTAAVSELPQSQAGSLLVVAFDADKLLANIRHLMPAGMIAFSLDQLKLPIEMLTEPHNYLSPLNFVTNCVFFRNDKQHQTRLVSANYWSAYGGSTVTIFAWLFDEQGKQLATWQESICKSMESIVIDSSTVSVRFALSGFTGLLFLHVAGAAGHDVVKYALDIHGENFVSSTHDANAWPADLYAGLPAPGPDEQVFLWLQNSNPCPIPAGALGLNIMGSKKIVRLNSEIAPFATYRLNVADLLPEARWPQQIEIHAGRYIGRPRYKIVSTNGHHRIAHVNIERTDLKVDPAIARLGSLMGKGFILPAPLLQGQRFCTKVLPTPMSTSQLELPIALLVYTADGELKLKLPLGSLQRHQCVSIDLDDVLAAADIKHDFQSSYGHLELVYDFDNQIEVDGWLHAIFRYQCRSSGHTAETSFGAHIFNTALTYLNEPQSYLGPAPGLTTRLFVRLAAPPFDTMCQLIYPVSSMWHQQSQTDLILHNGHGDEVARTRINIPASGSRLFTYNETFAQELRQQAGQNAYLLVRDTTCRLFGYNGLIGRNDAFSLDHMFGF